MEQIYVFDTDQTLVGRIKKRVDGYEFRYANSYISNKDAIAINPIHLPICEKNYFSAFANKYQGNGFSGVLSVFGDCLPGAWGEAILKSEAGRNLSDFELLLENQADRVGHLVFSETPSFPDIAHSRIKEPIDWEDVLKAKEIFETTKNIDGAYLELFKQGASQGGARPKISIIKDGQLYLAKLPSIRDLGNISQIEHGSLSLANALGINVAESCFFTVSPRQDIFLSKRFDYQGEKKVPFLSMKSVLAVDHGNDASYSKFAIELHRLNGGKDSEEIFKRMVFNSLVSNHDDHYLNTGIYFVDGQWRLTPAYDVVIGEGSRRTHVINVGVEGGVATKENLLSQSRAFNLSAEMAENIFSFMQSYIAQNWKRVLRQSGIDEGVITSINWAVLYDYPVSDSSIKSEEESKLFEP